MSQSSPIVGRTALLVEDDEVWLELLTRYLKHAGCIVTPARNLEEARHVIDRAALGFDVAVLDVRLRVGAQDQSGLLLLNELVASGRARRYLVITSAPQLAHRVLVELRGARYLSKQDLSRETVVKVLDSLLETPPTAVDLRRGRTTLGAIASELQELLEPFGSRVHGTVTQ